MSLYEIGLIGSPSDEDRKAIGNTLAGLIDDFDLRIGREVTILDGPAVDARNRKAAFVAAYFGSDDHGDLETTKSLINQNAPIIPVLKPHGVFKTDIPDILHYANALRQRYDDLDMTALSLNLLECIGLLRRQRRVFVSYRRDESRAAALQIRAVLDERGFDVFLDTHSILPGNPFQNVLWQRLIDSDVVVMLDTPEFFASRWTAKEIGRARAKEIQILRVIWPNHKPSQMTDLSETISLNPDDMLGADGPISDAISDLIANRVELLRSRSISSRYQSMAGKLKAGVEMIGGKIEGIGAHRAIAIRLPDDRRLWVYPVVGVPTAEILNDIEKKARSVDTLASPKDQADVPVLVYDDVGIEGVWKDHLAWLNEHIRVVRSVRVDHAGYEFAAW